MTSCHAKCCKRGSIYLQTKEEESLFPIPMHKVTPAGFTKVQLAPQCVHLATDNKCTVYEKRPKSCNEFPVYVRGNTIIIASWCTGYEEHKLDAFIEQFAALGCKVFIQ